MPHARNPSRGPPGFLIVWLLIASLVAVAMWRATQHVIEVDDRAANDAALRLPDMRIDINVAGRAELALLPGLGDMLAQRIVDDRAAHGPFATLQDLERVSGLGQATIARLEPFAYAGSRQAARAEASSTQPATLPAKETGAEQ